MGICLARNLGLSAAPPTLLGVNELKNRFRQESIGRRHSR